MGKTQTAVLRVAGQSMYKSRRRCGGRSVVVSVVAVTVGLAGAGSGSVDLFCVGGAVARGPASGSGGILGPSP